MRNDHDTEADQMFDPITFSQAVTRELDDGVPVMPADDAVTQKIVRKITDQDLLNEFETDGAALIDREADDFEKDEKTKVPTGDE